VLSRVCLAKLIEGEYGPGEWQYGKKRECVGVGYDFALVAFDMANCNDNLKRETLAMLCFCQCSHDVCIV
jgi:hypothetical protein